MAQLTITIGAILIAIGPVGFGLSGTGSMTAFIPSIFGVLILACGLTALNMKNRKHAMHAALALALLAVLGSAGRAIPGWLALARGEEGASPLALTMLTLTIGLCLTLIVFGVKSFIDARRQRQASGETAQQPG